jgi:hypothetical protein
LLLLGLLILAIDGVGVLRGRYAERRWRNSRDSAPPREAARMATMSQREWRRMRGLARGRVRRYTAWKLLTFPVLMVLLPLTEVEDPLSVVIGAVWAFAVPSWVIGWVRGHGGGDPLLLYGRVWSSWQGADEPKPSETFKNRMSDHAQGHAHRVAVEVRAAVRLRSDGSLSPAPSWRGRQILNTRSRLLRSVGDREHVALIATCRGHVICRMADVAGLRNPAPFPRRRLLKTDAQLQAWATATGDASRPLSAVRPPGVSRGRPLAAGETAPELHPSSPDRRYARPDSPRARPRSTDPGSVPDRPRAD